jgi:hypothetical protein
MNLQKTRRRNSKRNQMMILMRKNHPMNLKRRSKPRQQKRRHLQQPLRRSLKRGAKMESLRRFNQLVLELRKAKLIPVKVMLSKARAIRGRMTEESR